MSVIDHPREIVVGAVKASRWYWLVSGSEYWILDPTKLGDDRLGEAGDPESVASKRFGMQIVDERNGYAFLRAMEKYRIETGDLRLLFKDLMPVRSWDEVVHILPSLVADFDGRQLVSMPDGPAVFERCAPNGWEVVRSDVLSWVPPSERYWVINGRDCLEGVPSRARAQATGDQTRTPRLGGLLMAEFEATRVVLEGLRDENGLDVQARCTRRGLDRDLLQRVVDAIQFLIGSFEGRSLVPKQLAGAFVDIGGRLNAEFYSGEERAALRAAEVQLVDLAHKLFDPEGRAVMVVGRDLYYRGKKLSDVDPVREPAPKTQPRAVLDTEEARIDLVVEGLVGMHSIPVKLSLHQGFDRQMHAQVVESIRYLTEKWSGIEEVPRRIGVAFADTWNLWHLNIDVYPDGEQDLIQSSAIEIVELADKLLSPY